MLKVNDGRRPWLRCTKIFVVFFFWWKIVLHAKSARNGNIFFYLCIFMHYYNQILLSFNFIYSINQHTHTLAYLT